MKCRKCEKETQTWIEKEGEEYPVCYKCIIKYKLGYVKQNNR